jgi:hypothetical protein
LDRGSVKVSYAEGWGIGRIKRFIGRGAGEGAKLSPLKFGASEI